MNAVKLAREARVKLAEMQDALNQGTGTNCHSAWATTNASLYCLSTDPGWPEFRAMVKQVLRFKSLGSWRVIRTYSYKTGDRRCGFVVTLERPKAAEPWRAQLQLICIYK